MRGPSEPDVECCRPVGLTWSVVLEGFHQQKVCIQDRDPLAML